MADHGGGRLELGLDHLGGARLREGVARGLGVGAGQDRHVRAHRPDRADHQARPVHLGQRHHHQRGARDARLLEQARLGRVAEQARYAARAQAPHDVGIALDDHVAHAERLESLPHRAAHPPEPAEHHVLRLARLARGARLCRGHPPQAGDHRRRRAHQGRIDEDRDQGRRQRRVVDVRAHVSRAARHLDEDERELADLGEPDPDQQRGPEGPPEEPDHQRPQEELADHHHQHHGDEERNVRHEARRIDERPDGHEEERHEHVAERQEPRERLVRVLRTVDDEPGQERAEGQREARGLGERGGAQAHREGHQEEHLVAVHPGRAGHQRRDDARGHVAGRHQQQQGPPQRARDGGEPSRVEGAQGRDDHDEDHHREILDERDADHDAPVPRVQLAPVQQEARQHHGAGHRDHHPDHRALEQGPAHQARDGHAHRHRERDAERAAEQGDPLHAQEVVQGELDADREHEQDHADLGEQLEGVQVRDGGPGGERADQDAAQHVAQDQGLAGQPGEGAAGHRGQEDVGEIPEKGRFGEHGQVSHRRATGTKRRRILQTEVTP